MTRDGRTVEIVVVVTMGSVATGTEGKALQLEIHTLNATAQRALRGLIAPKAR